MTASIALSGVAKVFDGDVRAVDDVSFSVEPGEIVGLVGVNGAGKTTLLRILSGIIPSSERFKFCSV